MNKALILASLILVVIGLIVVASGTKPAATPAPASRSALPVPAAEAPSGLNRLAPQVVPDVTAEVETTLAGWAKAMKANDVKDELSFYSDQLDRYFLARNVTKDFVSRDKEEFYRRHRRIIDYHIDYISVDQQASGTAIVSLVKHWEISDPSGTKSGQTTSRLWLTRKQTRWLITGEQDLLVPPPIPSSNGPAAVNSDSSMVSPTTQDDACKLYPSLC